MSDPLSAAVGPDRRASALDIATSKPVVRLAIRTSLVVGSVLNLINQGDALLGDAKVQLLKLCLTYLVPYCVATYSATSISLRHQAGEPPGERAHLASG